MEINGTVTNYSAEFSSKAFGTVNLTVKVDDIPEPIFISVTGSLPVLCTKFKAIPFKNSFVAVHLIGAKCVVDYRFGSWRFERLSEVDY